MNQDIFETKLSEVCDWCWVEPSRIGNKGRILKAKLNTQGEAPVIHIKKIYKSKCRYIIRRMQYQEHRYWYVRCETCKCVQTKSGKMVPQPKMVGNDCYKNLWLIYNEDK